MPEGRRSAENPNKRVKSPCRAMHKEGQQPVPLTDPLSRGNPLCSPSLAQSHLCHSPSHWLGAILACSPCCRPVRHLFASFPLRCHRTRLLASCLWPKALLLTPGHVGLFPGLLGFPILSEHFPAEGSAAATFHSETKHVLTASGIPRSSFLAPRAVCGQTQLTRCTSHCTTCGASSHPCRPLGSGPRCAWSNSPFPPIPLWPSLSPVPHSPLEQPGTKSPILWPRDFTSLLL